MKALTPYPSEFRPPDNVYRVLPNCLATKQLSQWSQFSQELQVELDPHWHPGTAGFGNRPASGLRINVSDGRGKPG
jgi:hypothetical protein